VNEKRGKKCGIFLKVSNGKKGLMLKSSKKGGASNNAN